MDGLPLFSSSSQAFWPILAKCSNVNQLSNLSFSPLEFILVWANPPVVPNFDMFVKEATHLFHNGIVLNGIKVKIVIEGFICDAPANAFIMGVKSHTGYSSCTKCTASGTWYHNRVTFHDLNAEDRFHVGEKSLD
ncbi:hypothetical protein JTE90_025021 [Oedothorax gibbosus]|uniref:Uncharacterized protein n=1 Tax=Oedothorax gibbosus TaxID=931172 RepID=A0AAV6TMZ3_9ARAC|nr:hypothetical protein JTE90_025021 [Oedothorax gibbosus]